MVGCIRFYGAKPPASITVKRWLIAEILLKVALNTITVTQVILFINSSSKTYTLEDFLTKTVYVLSCYSCARLYSFHYNNGSATSPETKWSFSHVDYKVYLVNHIGASLNFLLWMLSLGCFLISLWNRGPTVVDNKKWILVW
jgi:hypothetical protein